MRTKPLPNIEGDENLIRTASALCNGANNHKILSSINHLLLLHELIREKEGWKPVTDKTIDYCNETLPIIRRELIDICSQYQER